MLLNSAVEQKQAKLHGAHAALLGVSTIALLASFSLVAGFALSRGNSLSFVSGAWSALAVDASEGLMYRPIASEIGIGGTRYMPLQFVLHGLVIRAGVDPVVAGHATAISGVFLLVVALAALMIRLDVPAKLAVAAATIVLASHAAFGAVTEIRADALPAALNVWGLFFCAAALRQRGDDDERSPLGALALAAICFALAFSAKLTTLYGPAVGFAALLLNRRYKPAAIVAGLTLIGLLTTAAIIHLASDGRALDAMRACAAGGSSAKYTLQAPLRMAVHLMAHDPLILLCLAVCGAAVLSFKDWQRFRELPTIGLILSLGATLAIFGTPGTSNNHFIDVFAAAIVFGAFQVARGRIGWTSACSFLGIVGVCGAMQFVELYRDTQDRDYRANVHSTLAIVDGFANPDRPLMSEDSMVPVIAGQRPYVADSWMLRVLSDNIPDVQQRIATELREHRYRAVLLCHDPIRDNGEFLEARVFGKGFMSHLNAHYELHAHDGRFWIYRPRGQQQQQQQQQQGADTGGDRD